MLSQEQLAQMDQDGFVVLRNLFTREEMGELADAIEQYVERHERELAAVGGAEGINRAKQISFTSHLAEQDESVRAFCLRREIAEIACQLLGPDVDLYWNQSVFKHPETEQVFPWHQDDAYTPVEPSPYLTLWLAISDATEENGCISVLPGSHKRGLVEHQQTPYGWACHSSEDPDQGILVPVPAGSLIAFWSLTMHKSGPNLSPGIRKAFVIQYANAGLKRVADGQPIENLIPVARNGNPVVM